MIGPLPTNKSGNHDNWILTWMDRTTKTIVASAAQPLHRKRHWHDWLSERFVVDLAYNWNWPLDNDVCFDNGLWKSLWKMCSGKLNFTQSYRPQADPKERANLQVMEAWWAALATVARSTERMFLWNKMHRRQNLWNKMRCRQDHFDWTLMGSLSCWCSMPCIIQKSQLRISFFDFINSWINCLTLGWSRVRLFVPPPINLMLRRWQQLDMMLSSSGSPPTPKRDSRPHESICSSDLPIHTYT